MPQPGPGLDSRIPAIRSPADASSLRGCAGLQSPRRYSMFTTRKWYSGVPVRSLSTGATTR